MIFYLNHKMSSKLVDQELQKHSWVEGDKS